MPRQKIGFPTKSFTIRLSEEKFGRFWKFIKDEEARKGVEVPMNVIANEALENYLKAVGY